MEELSEWVGMLNTLQTQSREISVIFNNNSGGHAAGNAADLLRLLGQDVPALQGEQETPKQLDLFEFP